MAPDCYNLNDIDTVIRVFRPMKAILNATQVQKLVAELVEVVASRIAPDTEVAIIGVRSRGEILAQRLAGLLSKKLGATIPCGTLDITMYRDDLNDPQGSKQPQVRATEIGFDIDGKLIILVDDVLYTGRSSRAALDALMDLGRPKAVRLAVLVDRSGRELPIQADFAAYKAQVDAGSSVRVNFLESDGIDQVVIE
jgi:pyrimidine operon attenuation protein/uracil phosphoribosyltransferase